MTCKSYFDYANRDASMQKSWHDIDEVGPAGGTALLLSKNHDLERRVKDLAETWRLTVRSTLAWHEEVELQSDSLVVGGKLPSLCKVS